jgi:hypothetical protein
MITLLGSANYFSTDTHGFAPGSGGGSGAVDTSGANFIAVWFSGGSGARTLSDSKGNTWIPLTEYNVFFGTRVGRWYYAYNLSGGLVGASHTFGVTGSGTAPTLMVLWYSGVLATADPFDTGNESGNSNNSQIDIQAGAVTPSEDGCLVLSGLFTDAQRTPTIDSGFVKEQATTDNNFGHFYGAAGDLIQTTATAVNPKWTLTSTDIVLSANAVFKATPGAGGPIVNTGIRSRVTSRPAPFKPMGDGFRSAKYRGWR